MDGLHPLTFFVELDAPALEALFDDAQVIPTLQQIGAGLAVGLIDLSPGRAQVIRKLNRAGIPLTAWLLLPHAEGYWFNLNNTPQALRRYQDFRAWSRQHGLEWQAVGLDIEPDINTLQMLPRQPLSALRRMLGKLGDGARLENARRTYQSLVAQIHADGLRAQSYQFCVMLDERRMGSTFLQRLAGVLDLAVDQEVLMLYSSFTRTYGAALLESYAAEAGGIGIGSTGGGVDIEGLADTRPLTWEELQRDLLLAQRHAKELFIFSLEGCIQQGFLARLAAFDWEQPAPPLPENLGRVNAARRLLRGGLWAARRWRLLLAAALVLWWLKRSTADKRG